MIRRFLYLVLLLIGTAATAVAANETMTLETVGKVQILPAGKTPHHVIVLVSGSQGWTGKASELAGRLAQEDTLVIGVDYSEYMKAAADAKFFCPCGELAHVAEFVEKQKQFKQYVAPVLVGLQEGSAPVYAAISEAPNTFLGAITFNFQISGSGLRRMCRGDGMKVARGENGDDVFLPDKSLKTPWLLFHSDSREVKDFVDASPGARIAPASANPAEEIRNQVLKWQQKSDASLKGAIDLPVIELPSTANREPLVVILTGDGGWTSLDSDLGDYLSSKGYAVVGFDLLRYLWSGPSAEQGTRDLDRLVSFYCDRWKKSRAILIGYSMGADVLPYVAPGLSAQTTSRLAGVVLIGPAVRSDFALDITDAKQEDLTQGMPLLPMAKNIRAPVLCIGGSIEKESLCRRISRGEKGVEHIKVELLESGHMFHDNFQEITDLIGKNLGVLK